MVNVKKSFLNTQWVKSIRNKQNYYHILKRIEYILIKSKS